MKKFLLKYGLVLAAVLISGGVLMDVSQKVQHAERQVSKNEKKIAARHETLRVLLAEWAYLNDPARLEALAANGLDLSVPDSKGLVSDLGAMPRSSVFIPSRKPVQSLSQGNSKLFVEISSSSDDREVR